MSAYDVYTLVIEYMFFIFYKISYLILIMLFLKVD